jgi:hypothetical protein
MHHDALEFPDGQVVLLTRLCEGQRRNRVAIAGRRTSCDRGGGGEGRGSRAC